jgi:hypothetical protein
MLFALFISLTATAFTLALESPFNLTASTSLPDSSELIRAAGAGLHMKSTE